MAIVDFCLHLPIALLVFLASAIPVLLFYLCRLLYLHNRKTKKFRHSIGCVPAVITEVGLDGQSWRDGWVVKAAWVDAYTQQAYTFQSSPQQVRPKKSVGDKVLIFVESTHPMRYSMDM